MPRAYGRNHAACIWKKRERHLKWKRRSVLCATFYGSARPVSAERRGASLARTATSNRPFRSSLTAKGARSNGDGTFSQRTSSGIPGFIPDSRRISWESPIVRRDQWVVGRGIQITIYSRPSAKARPQVGLQSTYLTGPPRNTVAGDLPRGFFRSGSRSDPPCFFNPCAS